MVKKKEIEVFLFSNYSRFPDSSTRLDSPLYRVQDRLFKPGNDVNFIAGAIITRSVCMARPAGFEPATYGFEARRSIQLSYGRITITRFFSSDPEFCQPFSVEKMLDMAILFL